MSYERRFGRGSYGGFGRSPRLEAMPSHAPVGPVSWEGGLDYRVPGQAKPNSTDEMLDVELTARGALRRVAGLRSLEELSYSAQRVAVQHDLEGKAEIIFAAAPYLGVRKGTATTWTDVGLSAARDHFAFTNYGGTLIFSDLSERVWTRQPGEVGATLTEGIPPARDYTTFAGRVFAGGTLIDGRYEPAGIRWSGEGTYLGWDRIEDAGADFELLISNTIAGEEFVAWVPMSFDYLAAFCRGSIWVGRRTGLLQRPVDFSPRVTGLSTVIERTIQNTPQGVVYLETAGVHLFDGNSTRSVGAEIEAELLPIARGDEELFHSAYDPVERQYFLFTPTQTFVLQLETGRWLRRSVLAKAATAVAEFSSPLKWSELTDVWANLDGRWVDLGSQEMDYKGLVFLVTSQGEEHLAEQSRDELTNLGIPLRPYALFPPMAGEHEVETLGIGSVGINYRGGGVVQLAWDSMEEDLARVSEFTLTTKLRPFTYYKGVGATTSSARARLFILSGDPEIRQVTQWVQRRGRRV